MPLIDLTQNFVNNNPVFPGDPRPRLIPRVTLESDGHSDFTLESSMHVGTHIDGPFHMIPGGALLNEAKIENFMGPARVIDARGQTNIDVDILKAAAIRPAQLVLICTGWSEFYGQDKYYLEYPVLTPAAAEYLVAQGITLVGLDSPSPDQPPFTVHKILLGNNIFIIENLTNLEALLSVGRFELTALPLKVAADSAPARVVAKF